MKINHLQNGQTRGKERICPFFSPYPRILFGIHLQIEHEGNFDLFRDGFSCQTCFFAHDLSIEYGKRCFPIADIADLITGGIKEDGFCFRRFSGADKCRCFKYLDHRAFAHVC